ncbi:MAG: hypothetical protein ACT4QD_01355 [Acidobacteriota bacterium]
MRKPPIWLAASQRLILAFVLVLLLPATAVEWLGVWLVDQDRALASRQLRDRRESAADRLTAALEQAVASTERRLDNDPTRLQLEKTRADPRFCIQDLWRARRGSAR